MTIRLPKFEAEAEQLLQVLGDSLNAEIPVLIGDPSNQAIYVDANTKTEIYTHSFGADSSGVTVASAGGLPQDKAKFGQPILIKKTPSGQYRYVGIDVQADEIYSASIPEAHTQEPVNVNQIRWSTIHPYSALQVLVVGAWYDGYYVSDLISDAFDGTAQDTSASSITVPSTNNKQIFVLIQVDATNGALEYKQSSEYPASIGWENAYSNSLLPTADSNRFRVGYVALKAGASALGYGDFWQAPSYISGAGGTEWNVTQSTDKTLAANTQIVLDKLIVASGTTVVIESTALMAII